MDENVKRIDKDLVLYMYIVYDMVPFLMQIAQFSFSDTPLPDTKKCLNTHTHTLFIQFIKY